MVKTIVLDPKKFRVKLDKLIGLYNNGKLEEALVLGCNLVNKYPNEPLLRNIHGVICAALNKFEEAITSYSKAVQIKGDYAEAYNNLGLALYCVGRTEEAVKYYNKALLIEPAYAAALNNLGNALSQMNKHEEAITIYSKALQVAPDYAEAHHNLGVALEHIGQRNQAIDNYLRAIQIKPDFVEAHYNIGIALHLEGRHDQAITYYANALQIKPDFAEAYCNIGIALHCQNKHEEAIDSYKKALQIRQNYAEAHHNLGVALKTSGRLEEAVACYKRAIQLKPDYAEALNNLGNALNEQGRHEEAISSLVRSLEINAAYPEAYNNLGNALNSLGRSEEAVDCYTKSLQFNSVFPEAYNNLGSAFNSMGRRDLAIASYEKALSIRPTYAEAHRNLSIIKKYTKDDLQIEQMLALTTNQRASKKDIIHLSFALGKAYEDVGEMKSSFQYYSNGNRLRKELFKYGIEVDKLLFAIIKSIFVSNDLPVLEKNKFSASLKKRPIFIVGMPRSGTTLVEQILASHSEVYGAGELGTLHSAVIPILSELQHSHPCQVTEEVLSAIRLNYLNKIHSINTDKTVITDKMPLNFRWLGFVLCSMPEARVINLQRDPIATCWSVFKHYFSGSGNRFAYDLSDIAEYYKLYADLMSFWSVKFPGKIYNLNYEALTESQEQKTRRLLEYCELGWEPKCLAFHKTERVVQTASAAQVRQEIYKGSSDAWRKYEAFIQPMIDDLNRK